MPESVIMKAINVEAMPECMAAMPEPYATTVMWLFDLLAGVAMNERETKMDAHRLASVFGGICGATVNEKELKGQRMSINVMQGSKMIAFFKRGITWRMGDTDQIDMY